MKKSEDCIVLQGFGAMALFLAWMEMSLILGRLPSIGLYIFMSVNVFKLLVKFLSVYSIVLIGFACAFTIILPTTCVFEHIGTSLHKVLVMMIGKWIQNCVALVTPRFLLPNL